MKNIEKRFYDYALSVDWNRTLMRFFVCSDITLDEFGELEGHDSIDKVRLFIKKYRDERSEIIKRSELAK